MIKIKRYYCLTHILFVMSFFSVDFIPCLEVIPANYEMNISYLIAITFWLGFVMGNVTLLLSQALIKKESLKKKILIKKQLPGIFYFRKENVRIYIGIIIGLITIGLDMMFNWIPVTIIYVIISITVYLILLHSIVDGKYYRMYKHMKENKNVKENM